MLQTVFIHGQQVMLITGKPGLIGCPIKFVMNLKHLRIASWILTVLNPCIQKVVFWVVLYMQWVYMYITLVLLVDLIIKVKIKKWAIKYPFEQIYNLSLNSIELAVFIDKLSQRLGINCCKLEWCNNYYLYIHTWTIRYTIYYAYTIKIENLSCFNQY